MLKLCILAVGNVNLADDLWGVRMAEKLKGAYPTIYCGATPENFISKVTDADVVVLLDSYNGDDFVLTDKVADCESISTHTYNLNIFADYFRNRGKEFYFLGVGKTADETNGNRSPLHFQVYLLERDWLGELHGDGVASVFMVVSTVRSEMV